MYYLTSWAKSTRTGNIPWKELAPCEFDKYLLNGRQLFSRTGVPGGEPFNHPNALRRPPFQIQIDIGARGL